MKACRFTFAYKCGQLRMANSSDHQTNLFLEKLMLSIYT